MSGLAAILRKKQPRALAVDHVHANPYASAARFPMEADRVYDDELNLLLMDGWVQFFL
jgi:hypothetical protein